MPASPRSVSFRVSGQKAVLLRMVMVLTIAMAIALHSELSRVFRASAVKTLRRGSYPDAIAGKLCHQRAREG